MGVHSVGRTVTWKLFVTPAVQASLREQPPLIKRYLRLGLDEIRADPFCGKPLRDELTGFHSYRAKRFRIVYKIEEGHRTVIVVAIGPRSTIYQDVTGGF